MSPGLPGSSIEALGYHALCSVSDDIQAGDSQIYRQASQVALVVKSSPADAGAARGGGPSLGSGRVLAGGH